MKVDVLQVEHATFLSRWSWWSKWVDVAVFDYESRPHLLQMKVNRINGKRFNVTCMTGILYRQARCSDVGDLVSMKKESP